MVCPWFMFPHSVTFPRLSWPWESNLYHQSVFFSPTLGAAQGKISGFQIPQVLRKRNGWLFFGEIWTGNRIWKWWKRNKWWCFLLKKTGCLVFFFGGVHNRRSLSSLISTFFWWHWKKPLGQAYVKRQTFLEHNLSINQYWKLKTIPCEFAAWI